VIQQASRGRHRDVRVPAKIFDLARNRVAAEQGNDGQATPAPQRPDFLSDLQGELSRGDEDERLEASGRGIEAFYDGDPVRPGFPGAGFCLADHVPSPGHDRDALLLNGSRLMPSQPTYCLEGFR
jgi:hypothetical protein